MRKTLAVALLSTLAVSACSNKSDGRELVERCPTPTYVLNQMSECGPGGDPAVLAALPVWAKPPVGVRVSGTTVFRKAGDEGIGYMGAFEGTVPQVIALYRNQLASVPEMKQRYVQSGIYLVRETQFSARSYLMFTPQKAMGVKPGMITDHVEIMVYVKF